MSILLLETFLRRLRQAVWKPRPSCKAMALMHASIKFQVGMVIGTYRGDALVKFGLRHSAYHPGTVKDRLGPFVGGETILTASIQTEVVINEIMKR